MDRESAIRATHAAVTLETLEALANKGLLRRAQKDVERGEVTAVEMTEAGLAVTVGGQRVVLVESGPSKATCTCPAPGVCQHVLAACLRLMQEAPATPADLAGGGSRAQEEWLALSDDDITATFGLPVLRAAHELAGSNNVEIEVAAGLTVRFPDLAAEVRGLPGAGLAGIIVSGVPEKRHAQFAAAALLAVRQRAGNTWEPPEIRKGSNGAAPQHRDELLRSAAAVLEEMTATGLARLSPEMVDRLDALSISAQTAELHRLSLLMRQLATHAGDWMRRQPHADLARLFADMSTCYALVHALTTNAHAHLTGVSRDHYFEIGSVDLTGIAAWPWRTQSGYEGLTLLMWDHANGAWATWTDARPRSFQGGFNATARFTQPGPWEGAESPAQIVRSRFRLLKARRNRWGRLSSSSQTRALVTGAATLAEVKAPSIDDWSLLEEALAKASPLGLRERDPRAVYQLVQPAAWERQPFDQISQSLVWILRDNQGRRLEMRLPFDDLARPAIQRLEGLTPKEIEGSRLLGRCVRMHGHVQMSPIAIVTTQNVVSLFLVNAPSETGVAKAIAPSVDEDLDEPEQEVVSLASPLSRLVLASVSALDWLSETGVGGRNREARSKLEELATQAVQIGIPTLAGHLKAAATSQDSRCSLRLRWVLSLTHGSMG